MPKTGRLLKGAPSGTLVAMSIAVGDTTFENLKQRDFIVRYRFNSIQLKIFDKDKSVPGTSNHQSINSSKSSKSTINPRDRIKEQSSSKNSVKKGVLDALSVSENQI